MLADSLRLRYSRVSQALTDKCQTGGELLKEKRVILLRSRSICLIHERTRLTILIKNRMPHAKICPRFALIVTLYR